MAACLHILFYKVDVDEDGGVPSIKIISSRKLLWQQNIWLLLAVSMPHLWQATER